MAITIRKGLKADFDPSKMVRGEFAFCYDAGEVYLCESPGEVIKLGTADTIEAAVTLCEGYASTASTAATSASGDADNSEAWAVGQIDGTDVPSTDPRYHNNAKYWAEQAAQSSGLQPATPTRLGVVKPDGTTVTVDDDGTIHAQDLTARADIATINGKVGANNGIATLDGGGKVPASQLPSYVDDVIEAYYYEGAFYEEDTHTTEITPESGKIYVDLSTNKEYRWGGSEYAEISASLALGETSGTAYEGIKGKANADNIATIQGLIPSTATTSNKLATDNDTVKSGMSAEILTRRTVGYTSKNLLHVLPSVVDTTDNGITYTITRNSEGEVTEIELNGTATADSTLMLNDGFDVKNQTTGILLISGFENASSHTSEYKLFFESVSGTIRRSYIKVYSGVTVTNLLCHPMVRDSKSTDIFEPYHNPLMDTIDDITDVIPSNASSSNKLATASDIPSVEPLTSEHLTALRTIIQG